MQTPKGEINDKVFELLKDEETLAKMEACKSPEDCYELVKEKIDISFEDFKESMTIGYSYLKESESGLLSEDELDQVAGGKSQQTNEDIQTGIELGCTIGGTVMAAVGAAAGVVAAAATAAS